MIDQALLRVQIAEGIPSDEKPCHVMDPPLPRGDLDEGTLPGL